MKYTVISKDSKKFKGNIHSHTINSDGHLSPQEAKAYYKAQGYDFLAFTDHEIYSDYRAELNDENFIILPGMEASANLVYGEGVFAGKLKKTHHVLALLGPSSLQAQATKAPFAHLEKYKPSVEKDQWDGLASAQALVNAMHERGLMVTYNHPQWSRVDMHEFADLQNIFALEVYNYGTVIECALGAGTVQWDAMLAEGKNIWGFASDDNHNQPKLPDSFGGAMVVCAESLTHDAITQSMLDGHFYSTSGVDIVQWGIEGATVTVECSPVRQIDFIVGGKVGDGESIFCQDVRDGLTTASYTLKGSESYVRIECTDKYGRKAWTNPYFIKE